MADLILASQSPRRKALLMENGIDFECDPAQGEEVMDESLPLDEALLEVAMAKAREVAARHPGKQILAADTIVVDHGQVLGKPVSLDQARQVLNSLSGQSHEVKTGVVFLDGKRTRQEVFTTRVNFRSLDPAEIESYVQSGSCLDKAGSYGIQEVDFVESIEGSYTNVVGLPIERIVPWLRV